MNPVDADRLAREWLNDSPGLSSDKGFEIIDRTRFGFDEWEVKCRIFSNTFHKMVEYMVVISDGIATCTG